LLGFVTIGSGQIGADGEFNGACLGAETCNPSKPYACFSLQPPPLCGCKQKVPGEIYMHYDPQLDNCVVNAGEMGCYEHVSVGGFPIHCTRGAYCDATQIDQEGTCLCDTGTLPDGFLCKLSHGVGM
jgi:hypothetical protein